MPVTNIQDIKKLGTILSIWAHPDDESFLAAGIMATAARNGQKVACVTATKGEKGSQDEKKWPASSLGSVRAEELKKACQILGVAKHYWLGYHDGECDKVSDNEAVAKLIDIIRETKPDTILTFGPDGMTGHTDHSAVSRWATSATDKTSKKVAIYHCVHTPEQYESHLKKLDEKLNIFFNIDEPPLVDANKCAIHFVLPAEVIRKKRRALAAQPSQTEVMLRLFGEEFLNNALAVEAFILAR